MGDLRAAASPTYDENDNDEDYSEAAAYLAVEELTQPLVGDGGDEELTQLEAGDVGDVGDQVGDQVEQDVAGAPGDGPFLFIPQKQGQSSM